MYSSALTRIGKLCTGCGICRVVAAPGGIEMHIAGNGYLRPVAQRALTDQEESGIAAICPGVTLTRTPSERDHPVWGPVVSVRTGHATDDALRHQASSGGALSAILLYLLDAGLVDRVVQTAADPEAPIDNLTVVSTTRDDVFRSAGSRYAPSAPLSALREELARPGRFAFVGKPCDIAALRAFAALDPEVAEKIPYCLSFFCAGIPSRNGTHAILARLGVTAENLAAFRYRGDGWPGFATATEKNGRRHRMSYADSWGGILSKHVQFRCKICPDGSGGYADLVCADAWYGDARGYPAFDETEGRSLMLARTETGEALVRNAAAAGYLSLQDIDIAEVAKMQPHQARRKQLVLSRLAALGLFGHSVPRFRGLLLWRSAKMAGWWLNLHSFLGTARRVVMRRLEA